MLENNRIGECEASLLMMSALDAFDLNITFSSVIDEYELIIVHYKGVDLFSIARLVRTTKPP